MNNNGPSVCHYCGVWLIEATSHHSGGNGPGTRTVDHIVPRSRNGPNAKRNLVPCCARCNGLKGSRKSACECRWCRDAWATYCPERAAFHPVARDLPVREIPEVELTLLAVWAAGTQPVLGPSRPKKNGRKARPGRGGGSPLSKVWGGHDQGWV